jgi:hypothetical protein
MEFYSRDIQILRQSQSKLALEYLNQAEVTPSIEELQRMTDILVECCLRPVDEDLKTRIKKLDKWVVDKKTQNGKK